MLSKVLGFFQYLAGALFVVAALIFAHMAGNKVTVLLAASSPPDPPKTLEVGGDAVKPLDPYIPPAERKFGDNFTEEELRACEVFTARIVQAGFTISGRAIEVVEFKTLVGHAALHCGPRPSMLFTADERMPPSMFFGGIGIGGGAFLGVPAEKLISASMRCQLAALKEKSGTAELRMSEAEVSCMEMDDAFAVTLGRFPPSKPKRK
jgi:hypothetical protein